METFLALDFLTGLAIRQYLVVANSEVVCVVMSGLAVSTLALAIVLEGAVTNIVTRRYKC